MTPKDVKRYFLTASNFAKETGLARTTLLGWLKKNKVPSSQQYFLEKLTKGALKAGVKEIDHPHHCIKCERVVLKPYRICVDCFLVQTQIALKECFPELMGKEDD